MTSRATSTLPRQQGVVLVVSLLILLVMTVLGVAAIQSTTLQERMAGNLHDRDLAFQAAEAALRRGEWAIVTQSSNVDGNWHSYTDFCSNAATSTSTCELTSQVSLARVPQYKVEQLPLLQEPGALKLATPVQYKMYRITSQANGSTNNSKVILQSVFKWR